MRTFSPWFLAQADARLTAVVVLPTPPFWAATARTLALWSPACSRFWTALRRTGRTMPNDMRMAHSGR